MPFCNIYTLEIGTLRHRVAQQCLISLGMLENSKDLELFSDNGDSTLASLYEDMIKANSKKINKEEKKRLEL